jgi:four helix bundle protein
MAVRHYKELVVWQRAMDLVVLVYQITHCFPKHEVFGLTNQMRRAAVSVPSNIAEGQGRGTRDSFRHFLQIARGSLQEVETQAILAQRLGLLPAEVGARLFESVSEVARIINGLRRKLASQDGL